jgi:hypothetical protein
MDIANDNQPPAPTARGLPILGRVAPDGRVRLRAATGGPPDRRESLVAFPNDSREA